ncbi:MAG: hypothetical protein KatS3mg064_2825 [Tepidiforma sp.]|nr:hypothetical protein [Tepidiforma sp.]GIW19668.1 MAG: hypothetical protein KatS3mg064_2825 [Tepidiforma sp.]
MQRDVLARVADAIQAAGVGQVYGYGLPAPRALPPALPPGGVSALVMPGATLDLALLHGALRHTYEVEVRVLVPLGDLAAAADALIPLPDELMVALAGRLASASGAYNGLRPVRVSAPATAEYAGTEFLQHTLVLEVSEHRQIIPGVGP